MVLLRKKMEGNLFYQQIDITLMGRKTYEQVLGFPGEFPYANTIDYVFSREKKTIK